MAAPAEHTSRVEHSCQVFRTILEARYRTQPVVPTEGCLELFAFLKSQGIRIALTTGFYRTVTDLILHRLGWDANLDAQRRGNRYSVSTSPLPATRWPRAALPPS